MDSSVPAPDYADINAETNRPQTVLPDPTLYKVVLRDADADTYLEILRKLARETQMTMLFVTHEMRFAKDVADRVVFFDAGQVAEEGTPEKIFTEPDNPRTQEFLRAVLGD